MKKLIALFGLVLLTGCTTIPVMPWSPHFDDYNYTLSEMVGYGCDNFWHEQDPDKFAEALADAGCNITSVEYMTWGSKYYQDPSPLKPKWEKFVKAMRARHIVILVCIHNDNLGSGKYGDAGLDCSHYKAQIRQARADVMSVGPEGLIVIAVSETQTSEGKRFEAESIPMLNAAGYKTCYQNGSRPKTKDGCWTRSWHSSSISDFGNSADLIAHSDHGNVIRVFGHGDVFATSYDPALCAQYVKGAHEAGRGGIIYGFAHKTYDLATMKAVGAVR